MCKSGSLPTTSPSMACVKTSVLVTYARLVGAERVLSRASALALVLLFLFLLNINIINDCFIMCIIIVVNCFVVVIVCIISIPQETWKPKSEAIRPLYADMLTAPRPPEMIMIKTYIHTYIRACVRRYVRRYVRA